MAQRHLAGGARALLGLSLVLAGCGGGSHEAPRPSARTRALLAELPAAYAGADLSNGAAEFSLCRTCHTVLAGGANMTGPNLFGVFGRRLASAPGYAYSDALRAKGGVWTADRLDAWLAAPGSYVPGTKMAFLGLKDRNDRRDVIAYLKLASAGAAP